MTTPRLPPRLLRSFQDAWFADYGVTLSDEEAEERALRLIDFMHFIARLIDEP